MIEEFLRDQLELHFERSLHDRAVHNWQEETQELILDTLPALCVATAARLRVQPDGAGEAAEAELVPMLSSLALALDPECLFHIKHRSARLPSRFLQPLAEVFLMADEPDVGEVRGGPLGAKTLAR